jgi:hypothetical protein
MRMSKREENSIVLLHQWRKHVITGYLGAYRSKSCSDLCTPRLWLQSFSGREHQFVSNCSATRGRRVDVGGVEIRQTANTQDETEVDNGK